MPDLSLPVAGDPRDGSEGGSTEVEIAAATVELYNELKGSESVAGLATLQAILDGTYAPVEDAALTGTPTAPTAAPGTDTTQVATTEFVGTAVDNATYLDLSTRVFIPARLFAASSGSVPTFDNYGAATRRGSWLLDAATTETVAYDYQHDRNWSTADLYVHWTNAGAGVGDVVLRADHAGPHADGANTDSVVSEGAVTTITAPAQSVKKVSLLRSGVPLAQYQSTYLRIVRLGGAVADTLANDAALIGVELRKAS